jgi:hypothetical protein
VLGAMNEDELRGVELMTLSASKIDIISDTWPLWYSIYIRCGEAQTCNLCDAPNDGASRT